MAEQRLIGDWVIEREIGSGSFAKVWRATHRITQQAAAVKEINMEKLNKKLLDSLRSEVTVLKHTKHHNIVCLLDLIQDTTSNRLYIVLEFCAGGDLGHYIKRYRQVSEATARYFLQQLAEGLKELRRHNVIHRDLKPQNLLLSDSSSTPLLKIADFGFARSLAPQGLAETLCGSPLYMAPEILQFHKYDAKADLWSIGTILYELLVGKPPFNGANHMQLLRNIERNEARLPEAVAARLSPACKGLLARLLQRNPVKRMSFEEFFQHPFLTGSAAPASGVPPSLLIAPASAPQPAPQAALPAAVRQAAAAAVTAASGADTSHRGSTAGLPRPSLHLHARQSDTAEYPGHGSHALQQHQHQQQQLSENRPYAQQQYPPYMAPRMLPQQQQPPQQMQQVTLSVPQQQQQALPSLVSRPVSTHPLAALEPIQQDEAELMSDSMEGDFVVVYNPTGCAPQARSGSNSSSKASSGLVDPKAAAVLAGAPVSRPAWAGQHEQVQPSAYGSAAGAAITSSVQQRQHVHYVPMHGISAADATGVGCSTPWIEGHVSQTSGLPAESTMPHSVVMQPPTASQRLQLLVQVVHGCVCLLTRCQEVGGASAAGDTAATATQQGQQLALTLLALQVVQALCLPQSVAQHGEAAQCAQASCSEDISVSAMLGAATQNDLEQLMSAAVELLQLVKNMPGIAGSSCGDDDDGLRFGAASGFPTGDVSEIGMAGGLGRLAESLVALPLPDPFEVLQEYALDNCRAAAVEEVMGNWQSSMAGYSLAADLLLFLSCDWPQLGPADPALQPDERAALHELYAAVNARLAAVVAEAPSAALY